MSKQRKKENELRCGMPAWRQEKLYNEQIKERSSKNIFSYRDICLGFRGQNDNSWIVNKPPEDVGETTGTWEFYSKLNYNQVNLGK